MKENLLKTMNAHQELTAFLEKRFSRLKECPPDWKHYSARIRKQFLKLFFQGHPAGILENDFRIEWGETISMPGYIIRKLRYEGYPGMWIPALLYEPENAKNKLPGVLNPNGHHRGGKAMPYKQARCINLVKRGMVALNYEFIGMGELTENSHNDLWLLDMCGVAGIGVFYLAMKRALDILYKHPRVDQNKIAMTGLSGGGWQTIILSALDKRISAAVPVAGHSPVWQRLYYKCDIGDAEQIPTDFCTVADYDTLGGMMAPRPTLFIFNKDDNCCFRPKRTRSSVFLPAQKIFSSLDAEDKVSFYVNKIPGTHNYDADSRAKLYQFLNKHFQLKTPNADLPWENEALSEEELKVTLPADNQTIHSLAIRELQHIRKTRKSHGNNSARKKNLAKLIGLEKWPVNKVTASGKTITDGYKLRSMRLHLDNTWKLPLKEVSQPGSKTENIYLCLSDAGHHSISSSYLQNIASENNATVFAADIFNIGEMLPETPYYNMLVAATGKRSLGIQVGQILSIMQWLREKYHSGDFRIHCIGQATAIAALAATAIESDSISSAFLPALPTTLGELLRKLPLDYPELIPAISCFGLLKEFDIPDLISMAAPCVISRF